MSGAGNHPVDPAEKAADAIATRELLHQLEEFPVVGEEVQQTQCGIGPHAQLDSDVLVGFVGELGVVHLTLNEAKHVGVQERRQPDAVVTVEVCAKPLEIVCGGGDVQACSAELHHERYARARSARIASRTTGSMCSALGYAINFTGTLAATLAARANWRVRLTGSVTAVLKVFRRSAKHAWRFEKRRILTLSRLHPRRDGRAST